MRISADATDPDCHIQASRVNVFFNGEPIQRCITADDERGEILAFKLSEDGKPMVDGSGSLATETLHGTVRIELPKDFVPEWRSQSRTNT